MIYSYVVARQLMSADAVADHVVRSDGYAMMSNPVVVIAEVRSAIVFPPGEMAPAFVSVIFGATGNRFGNTTDFIVLEFPLVSVNDSVLLCP